MQQNVLKLVPFIFSVILALTPTLLFASTNYVISGFCAEKSKIYSEIFFDISNGTVSIGNKAYQLNGTKGLLVEHNAITNVYVYKPIEKSVVVIGTVNANQDNGSFRGNGVLIAKIFGGNQTQGDGGNVIKIENFIAGCPNYTITFALGDEIITTSNLNTRGTPSIQGESLGTAKINSQGVVIDGPISENLYLWWKVRYDSGLNGWSAGNWLTMPTIANLTPTSQTAQEIDILDIDKVDIKNAPPSQLANILEAAQVLLEQMLSVLKGL